MEANFLTVGSHEVRGSLFKTLTQGSGEKRVVTGGGVTKHEAQRAWSHSPGVQAACASSAMVLGELPEYAQHQLTGLCTQILPSVVDKQHMVDTSCCARRRETHSCSCSYSVDSYSVFNQASLRSQRPSEPITALTLTLSWQLFLMQFLQHIKICGFVAH